MRAQLVVAYTRFVSYVCLSASQRLLLLCNGVRESRVPQGLCKKATLLMYSTVVHMQLGMCKSHFIDKGDVG